MKINILLSFSTAGMVVTATFNDGSTSNPANYSVSGGNNMAMGTSAVTISYTYDGVTKNTSQSVGVVNDIQGNTWIINTPGSGTWKCPEAATYKITLYGGGGGGAGNYWLHDPNWCCSGFPGDPGYAQTFNLTLSVANYSYTVGYGGAGGKYSGGNTAGTGGDGGPGGNTTFNGKIISGGAGGEDGGRFTGPSIDYIAKKNQPYGNGGKGGEEYVYTNGDAGENGAILITKI